MSDNPVFNNVLFRELREKAQLSREDMASALGVSAGAVRYYENGSVQPPVQTIIRICNYFDVHPIDAFLTYSGIEVDVSEVVSNLDQRRREAYELLAFTSGSRANMVSDCIYYPWPYNLLRDMGLVLSDPMTEDHIAGLKHALGMLPDRVRRCILLHYEDGQTLEQIGTAEGITCERSVTRERVRQIIRGGVRVLCDPVHVGYIRYGMKGQALEKKAYDLRNGIEAMLSVLKQIPKYDVLVSLFEGLESKDALISFVDSFIDDSAEVKERAVKEIVEHGGNVDEIDFSGFKDVEFIRSSAIEDVGHLSKRAYNGLRRSGLSTVGDVIDVAARGELRSISNLGKVSVAEIVAYVKNVSGEDYSVENGLPPD